MSDHFKRFLAAFPPNEGTVGGVNALRLTGEIQGRFETAVPAIVTSLWAQVGCGYFANGELYVFGDESASSKRDSLVDWNSMDYWAKIFPLPKEGGPLFFAETCFGMQIGFRWEQGVPIGYLLDVDTMEAFRVATDCEELFGEVLGERYAFTDPKLLEGVRQKIGDLPVGMHYAPIVSPLAGGPLTPDNYHLETPNVHIRTSIATWEAIKVAREGYLGSGGIWGQSLSSE